MIRSAAIMACAIGIALPASASTRNDPDAEARNAREIVVTYQLNDSQLTTPGPDGVAQSDNSGAFGNEDASAGSARRLINRSAPAGPH